VPLNAELHCQFATDGRKLLTIDGKGTMRLWELSTGQVKWQSAEIMAHRMPALSCGGLIVGSSFDARCCSGISNATPKAQSNHQAPLILSSFGTTWPATMRARLSNPYDNLCGARPGHQTVAGEVDTHKTPFRRAVAQRIKELSSPVFTERDRASREL